MTSPLFSVVSIAKNESKTLPRLVSSLAEFKARGGEIIVVDTGSTDGTPEIARKLGCTVFEEGPRFMRVLNADIAGKINAKFVEADEPAIVKDGDKLFNFAAARNFAASKASHDWIFVLDCDEAFTRLDIDAVTRAMETPKAAMLECEFVFAHDQFGQPIIQFRVGRCFNRLKFHYNPECIVHETVSAHTGAETIAVYLGPDALKFEHWQNQQTNRNGYLVGLALDCYLHPDNDRNSHYFARELMYKGRYQSAIKEFQRHIAMNKWPVERAQSMVYIGDCCKVLGKVEESLDWWNKAFLADGTRREPLMRLAHYFFEKDDKHKTAAYASAALVLPRIGAYMDNENHYRQEPHELLYWALWWLGDKGGSAYHWRKAIGYQPRNPKYLHDAQFYNQHVTICIPTLGREEELKRLLELIPKTVEYPDYDVIVEQDSFESRVGVPRLLKKMVEKSKGDFVVFLGNDCIPRPGWLRIAMEAMRDRFWDAGGLVSFNGGYWHGEFADHFLISKKLLPMLNGEIFHCGYNHCGCDEELTARCKQAGKYFWCEAAKVEHDHPCKTGVSDQIYELGRSHQAEDKALLERRAKEIGFPCPPPYYSRPVKADDPENSRSLISYFIENV